MSGLILAVDQGTTSTRAIVFGPDRTVRGKAQREIKQHYPQDGWVEHDPEEIWESVLWCCKTALIQAGVGAAELAGLGITNQRETTVVWEKASGKSIYPAIVWQDRRTAETCQSLKDGGHEPFVAERTGLLVDPYFSATKIKWILDNVEGARESAEQDQLAFGTIDSFLIWRLTGGRVHATDATNASRTLLFDLKNNIWDKDLQDLFGIPAGLLPDVKDCSGYFGVTEAELFGASVPILGVAGDQHAATMGQACFEPGMLKSTYGTGCFALLNTGSDLCRSKKRLLTTLAYRLDGVSTYALEGSIFVAGAAVQWLRDGLKLINSAAESGSLAETADPTQNVYMVPAFVGLGAPWWDAEARGAIYGITRNTGRAELARSALEAVCYQTLDLLEAMHGDWGGNVDTVLRVDGGMVSSDWTMQFLADVLDAPVDRPTILETTALGAAWLAGSAAGVWPARNEFAAEWARDRRFHPMMSTAERVRKVGGWTAALRQTLSSNHSLEHGRAT